MIKQVFIILFYFFLSTHEKNLTAIFSANFENNPELPTDGFSEEIMSDATITVIKNPFPDMINPSEYVIRNRILVGTSSKSRAEYSTRRVNPTNERKLIFTFKLFVPEEFLVNIDCYWSSFSQFKTWPCEVGTSHEEEICYGGGIFNDIGCEDKDLCSLMSQTYRAEPDCFEKITKVIKGYWAHYVHEIYFTNTNNGYWRSYWNGILYDENDNVKTLFDNFPLEDDGSSECDLYWTVGIYGWHIKIDGFSSADYSQIYLDDIAVYDPEDGVSVDDLINTTILDFTCNEIKNSDGACNGPFNGICLETGKCNCYYGHSGTNCAFECSEMCYDKTYCGNEGECVCRDGWEGDDCETPICSSCPDNSECIGPELCLCNDGLIPPECTEEEGTECEGCTANMY